MLVTKLRTVVWLTLSGLTLLTLVIADAGNPSEWMIVLICAVFTGKGHLVIDHFMGLWSANRRARWLMLGYFYLLAPLIGLAFLFPDVIRNLTSL